MMRFKPVALLLAVCLAAATGCATTSPSSWLRNPFRGKDEDIDRLFNLARLTERHQNNTDAAAMYNRVLEMDPQYQPALHRLAVVAARQGQFDESLKYFDRALQSRTKPSAELLTDLGYVHYRRNELNAAETRLREALKVDPYCNSAHNNLGLVLGEQRRFAEALEEFRKGGDEAKAYANLAYVQSQAGELRDAERNYHRALALDNSLKNAAEALVQLQNMQQQALVAQNALAQSALAQNANSPQESAPSMSIPSERVEPGRVQQAGAAEPSSSVRDAAVAPASNLESVGGVRRAAAQVDPLGIQMTEGRVVKPRTPVIERRPAVERENSVTPPNPMTPAPNFGANAAGPSQNGYSTPSPSMPSYPNGVNASTMRPQALAPPAQPLQGAAPLTTVPITSTDMSQPAGPNLSGAPFAASGPTFSAPALPRPTWQ